MLPTQIESGWAGRRTFQAMPTPPRKWLINPQVFGTHDTAVRWLPANTPSQEVARRLARVQHEVAYQTRVLMVTRSTTRPTLAAAIGISNTQLGRVLSGAIPITLTHIAAIEQHFAAPLVTVHPPIEQPPAARPPGAR